MPPPPPRRVGSAPNLPAVPAASGELLRALSEPDLRQAASAYARQRSSAAATPSGPAEAAAEVMDTLTEHTRAAQGELRWQAFLAPSGGPTQVATTLAPGMRASLEEVTLGDAQNHLAADRGQLVGTLAAGDSDSVGVAQNNIVSSLSASHSLGGPTAASLGASIVVGGRVKGLAASSSLSPDGLGQILGVGAGLTAITDNRIEVLGTHRKTADGRVERLVRLKSEFMPILDVSGSTAATTVSVGVRLTVFGGRAGVMEKFVGTDKLAAMLRQRDVWYRPALETVAALGLKVGFQITPAAKLADEVVRGGGLEVAESYAFTRQKGLTFGVSLGTVGVKSTVSVMTQSGSALTLRRIDAKTYELAVAPSRVRAISGGVDASVIGEVFATLSKAFVQRRVWQFDTSRAEARVALGAALNGHLPGTFEAVGGADGATLAALHGRQHDERLPPGVTSVLTELGEQTELAAGVAGLRPLASTGLAAGLGLGRGSFEGTHGVALDDDSGVLTSHVRGSRRSSERLLGGAAVESVSSTVRELKDGAAGAAFADVEIAVDFELKGGMGASRGPVVDLAGRLAQVPLGANTGARRSDLYQMQGRWMLDAHDLDLLAQAPRQAIEEAAGRSGLPALVLKTFTKEVARARVGGGGSGGDPRLAMASVLAKFVKSGRSPAVVALKYLLGDEASAQMQFSVKNARHERTLAKFLRLDALLRGAKSDGDVARVAKGMGSFTRRASRQIAEISGDAVRTGLTPQEQAQAIELLRALRDSAAASRRGLLDTLPKKP